MDRGGLFLSGRVSVSPFIMHLSANWSSREKNPSKRNI